LNYKSPTTIGNANLEPESIFASGLKWNTSNFNVSAAVFNRKSDLIDYVKAYGSLASAKHSRCYTKGFETQLLL
jgi:iron complex outermembrane receptor protein